MRLAVLVIAAACGGNPRFTSNTMRGQASTLADVGAPHVAIVVDHDGLNRVWLDTGRVEPLAVDGIAVGESTFLVIANAAVTIRQGDAHTTVAGVHVDKDHRIVVSQDGARFAVQDGGEIAIVTIADAGVARVALPTRKLDQAAVSLAWTRTGDALLVVDDNERYRLDLATGTRTPVDALEWKANARPEPTDCRSRGLRLERRVGHGAQEIALVALARPDDPEHVGTLTDRVLVASTNHPDVLRSRFDYDKPTPGPLEVAFFTPSCEHFVFSLENRIYVGNVATGRYAAVTHGSPVWLPAAPLPGQ